MADTTLKLDGRPDLNPYPPTSIAHHAWRQTRIAFDKHGRAEALRIAADYDRNLNMGLVEKISEWKSA